MFFTMYIASFGKTSKDFVVFFNLLRLTGQRNDYGCVFLFHIAGVNNKAIERRKEKIVSKEYYTIIREYYGFPDYINTDLSEKEDCFAFDTEYEANQCLRDIFKNGEWMEQSGDMSR